MADEKDIAAEEGGGGGRKKLIIIIVAAALLLAAAGGAAYFLLGGGDEDPAGDGEAAGEATAVEEGDPVYHKLDPAFVVNLPPGGPAKMLQIAIQVMARDPAVVEALQANDPMIRHHLLDLLEQQQAADLLQAEGRESLQDAIRELIDGKLEQLGAPGEIKGVYFTQFVMQ
jgi:flagellar FliL protein